MGSLFHLRLFREPDWSQDGLSSRLRGRLIFLKKVSILLSHYSYPFILLMSVPVRRGRLNNNSKHRGHTGSRSVLAKDLGKVSMYIHRCLVREHTQVSPFSQMRWCVAMHYAAAGHIFWQFNYFRENIWVIFWVQFYVLCKAGWQDKQKLHIEPCFLFTFPFRSPN